MSQTIHAFSNQHQKRSPKAEHIEGSAYAAASTAARHVTSQPPASCTLSRTKIRHLPMISLVIDGMERVCLAQISSTLLKRFSYNEIHNRRVALGINCLQCTPLQLDLLRGAGAMPVTSRRCGMITKREAERLVNSFLDENRPLTLPDNFFFEVQHKCGFGCRGVFYPSRYLLGFVLLC